MSLWNGIVEGGEALVVDPGAPELREKPIKIGAKVVRHPEYVTVQMPEVPSSRKLFGTILDRTQRFGVPPPLVQRG